MDSRYAMDISTVCDFLKALMIANIRSLLTRYDS